MKQPLNITKGVIQQIWNEAKSPSTCIIKAFAKDGTKQTICTITTCEQDQNNANVIQDAITTASNGFQTERSSSKHIGFYSAKK